MQLIDWMKPLIAGKAEGKKQEISETWMSCGHCFPIINFMVIIVWSPSMSSTFKK